MSTDVQRKIRQLAFLHANYCYATGSKIPVNQAKLYEVINRDYQHGYMTLADIESDIKEYLEIRKNNI